MERKRIIKNGHIVVKNPAGRNQKYVSLDDLMERTLAKSGPAMFFQLHKPPMVTVKSWLGILETPGIIFYLHPYSNHILKRTVKTA